MNDDDGRMRERKKGRESEGRVVVGNGNGGIKEMCMPED